MITKNKKLLSLFLCIFFALVANIGYSKSRNLEAIGNFGLPGIIDLPTAKRLPDGELVISHQNNKTLFMTGISFQALPRLGVSFRYGGQGTGGYWAQGRYNWDRSFDAHLTLIDEGRHLPAVSIGLRDFIGTGWYSSEYLVGTKTIGNIELSSGLGFGRLAGRGAFSNPLSNIFPNFETREKRNLGVGGTLGSIKWFQGDTSAFFGLNYRVGKKLTIASEYTSDVMFNESQYLEIKSPWNFGLKYRHNDYVSFSTQYLYGSQVSLSATLAFNPERPPVNGGNELAPVPMRLRGMDAPPIKKNNKKIIERVLIADKFQMHQLTFHENTVRIDVTNTKFRSIAQAVGRIASTLQRFTSDNIISAEIVFHRGGLQIASYQADLAAITNEQFNPLVTIKKQPSIIPVDLEPLGQREATQPFSWGIGPYVAHRLFNPDLPLSLETGLEVAGSYNFNRKLKISGSLRKSILTNFTDNQRLDSYSVLPRVHSDWPYYDLAGQGGHIHEFKLSYITNFAPGLFLKTQAGYLEPHYAGLGAEILYKPAKSNIAFGFDINRVRMRSYNMLFGTRKYETTVGHLSAYYDVGGMFDIEINAGRYLAKDWGATTTISRRFGTGWEVGGYATLTDVPFDTFGEGSFDKAIFVSIPIDWITSTPNKTKRRLGLRPITRDGGAHLASARSLHRFIKTSQNAEFSREYGRLWK